MRATLSGRLTRGDLPLRGALLMPLCALAVHQLRFYVVFGSHAPAVLSREGHGYFQVAEPAVVLLAALGLGWFAGRLALAGATRVGSGAPRLGSGAPAPRVTGDTPAPRVTGDTPAPRLGSGAPAARGILRTWLVCAMLLFAIYCCQELCEGFFSPGHPAGIAGVLGHGGWTAAPISLLVGAALAIALRVAHRLLAAAAQRSAPRRPSAADEPIAHRDPGTADWRLEPRSGVAAGRAPPRSLSLSLI